VIQVDGIYYERLLQAGVGLLFLEFIEMMPEIFDMDYLIKIIG